MISSPLILVRRLAATVALLTTSLWCMQANAFSDLSQVRALIYSTTAAELQWSRLSSDPVQVSYNGQVLQVLDANSYFADNLDPNVTHHFELRTVAEDNVLSAPAELVFSSMGFTLPVREIRASAHPVVDENSATVSGSDQSQPEPTPVPESSRPVVASVPVSAGDCVVYSLSDLSSCVNAAQGVDRINIQSDLSCTASNCCPTGGPLLRFNNIDNLVIEGNGYRLLREGGQRQCSLLDVTQSRQITLRNWFLDDDERVAPCVVNDECPRMLHIRNSEDVTLDYVSVRHGKGYVIYVQQVDGFAFVNSHLHNSGVLGLYVGHSSQSSTNVRIQNSAFTDNQTNAVALLGVNGAAYDDNIISNNIFMRNHWRGQWQVAPQYGTGFTGGGQLYIAQASGLTVRDNVITDGYCENCFVQQRFGSGVSGIEISIPGRQSVNTVLITRNRVANHDAWGVFVNEGATVNSLVVIRDNQLIDNTVGLKPDGASVSGNSVQNR